MKKITLIVVLLAFVSMATAQNMADRMVESVAAHLNLNASQKQAVLKLYKTASDKQRQKREVVIASSKSSDQNQAKLAAREKAEKSKKNRKVPKTSKKTTPKSTISASDRFLMTAYGKARSNPDIMQGLEKILTPQQYKKWQQLGKR